MIVPVILSGGAGTRLWPLSRQAKPKQFQPVVGANTMLRTTAERLAGIDNPASPIVVCNEAHADLVREQIPEAVVLAEPVGRNTAPAIAAAALQLDHEAVMVVLPSDHLINDVEAFQAAVRTAIDTALEGWLVTFGVVPDRPATGYGYIQPGAPLSDRASRIASFVEKPDVETAAGYVADGYLWNSGMFVMKAGRYLEELQSHRPDIAEAVASAVTDGQIEQLEWLECPAESIDYAVMEETNRAAVIGLEAGWSDVGSWSSLLELGPADEYGNVVSGEALVLDSSGSYVRTDGRFIAVAGVEDLIVVDTGDAVLVIHKDRAQDVKSIIEHLPESLL